MITQQKRIDLLNNQIHIWSIPLNVCHETYNHLTAYIDAQERQIAARYRYSTHRRRFIVRRAVVRLLISQYLSQPPDHVRFDTDTHGKPRLSEYTIANSSIEQNRLAESLQFNVSHSNEYALLALSVDTMLGIDIEKLESQRADRLISKYYFAPNERHALEALPEDQYTLGFFHCWTRKEAFVKALGQGLSIPLDQFEVTLNPHSPARLVRADPGLLNGHQWSLYDIHTPDGYAGAIVCHDSEHHFAYYHAHPDQLIETHLNQPARL